MRPKAMKEKKDIVENWLPRYTGTPLAEFGEYVLLTNFDNYVEWLATLAFRDIGRRTREIDPSFSVVFDGRMGRFYCTNEGAHEFAVDLLGNGVHINAFASEELARVGNSVDPSGFDAGALEACCLQLRSVFAFL